MRTFLKHITLLFIFAIILIFQASQGICAPATLSQIRLGRQDEKTVRVVAHLDDKNPCRIFTLQNPNRVVIDFDNTVLDKTCVDKTPPPTGFIHETRLGQPLPKQTRIVLETSDIPVYDNGFYLAPNSSEKQWRFVIDLKLDKPSTVSAPKTMMTPLAATQNTIKPAKLTKDVKKQKPLIVIDPGHGGSDPGAISSTGHYEKNLTLQMAKETKQALLKTGKYRVLLTRETDKALALRERTRFAHRHEADLFISIHADSARNKNAKGLSVYTISERASDREAQLLAERDNKADIILGIDLSNELPEVSNILIDLAKRDTMDKSALYANLLVARMARQVTLVKNAHRFAGFVVLKSANIPSVLIEIGYLSNRQEEKLLQTKSYRAKLANSIVESVGEYFNSIYD